MTENEFLLIERGIVAKGVEIENMIEKFSKEELETIKRELGIVGEVAVNKGFVCSKSKKELEDIWAKKYHEISKDKSEVERYIYSIIDMALCNFRTKTMNRKFVGGTYEKTYLMFNERIDSDLVEDYEKMHSDIVDVIKKYDKEYKNE